MDTSGLVEIIREVTSDHPVDLVILFGSHARGTVAEESDIDLAVAFSDDLDREDRFEARIDLIVDLSKALDRNDLDVADLDSIRPAVGLEAIRQGILCVGDQQRRAEYRHTFEQDVTPPRTHEEQIERFDEIIEALEGST